MNRAPTLGEIVRTYEILSLRLNLNHWFLGLSPGREE